MRESKNKIQELESLLKKTSIRYMYIVIGIYFVFTAYFWYEELMVWYFTGAYLIFHIVLLFIPLRIDYNSIKRIIPVYMVMMSLYLYPIVVFFWQIHQVSVFMWFFVLPMGALIFFEIKTVIVWMVYIVIEIISIIIVSDIIPHQPVIVLNDYQQSILGIITICSCLMLICFFIYSLNKTNQIKIKILQRNTGKNEDEHELADMEKYKELYHQVLDYFETQKPYCDSDFSINQLADAMDTNITYISKAININKGMNFNQFINIYRINMVKNMLSDDFQNKYTIRYIYISSGFKHQSTFNKVFKQIEGITPSEHIRKMNKTKELS